MRMPLRSAVAILLLVVLAACGGGKGKSSSKTTETSFEDTSSTLGDETASTDLVETSTTLPGLAVDITPSEGKPGTSFALSISDFKEGEKVKFEIDFPSGKTYTGPEHTVPASGKLTVNYRVASSDPTGEYTVKANGDKGSLAEGKFTVSGTSTATTGRTGTTAKRTTTTAKGGTTTTTRSVTTVTTRPVTTTSTTTPSTTSTSPATTTTTTP